MIFIYLIVTGKNAGVYKGNNIYFVICIVCVNRIVRFEVAAEEGELESDSHEILTTSATNVIVES
jgi:hypothetical protein